MSPFARWMTQEIERKGIPLKRLAEDTEIDYSYLFKVRKSYEPQYSSYQRPSYEKTKLIGHYLGDVAGALRSANYEIDSPGEVTDGKPATLLIREQLARYNGEGKLEPGEMEELSSELEDFAYVRVSRRMRQAQKDREPQSQAA